ncbi:MAG: hypothetical protein IPM57_05735 [Oligoflexia bacterium]|nr:hypothetical protein [Oligoflexia bacterium]
MLRLALTCILGLSIASCVTSKNRTQDESDSVVNKLRTLRADGPRKRIIILPFFNESFEKDDAIAKTARDTLIKGLKRTDNFIIVDNTDLGKDLDKYKTETSYNMDELGKVAQDLGVVAIVEGHVVDIKAKKVGEEVGLLRSMKADVTATVGVRVYSSSSKKEVFNETRSAMSSEKNYRVLNPDGKKSLASDPELIREALAKALNGFVLPITKSVDKLAWNGRIAYVRGEKVYLNAGRLTGISVGDILKVLESGEDVYDPESGIFIGKAPGRVKGTLEVVSYFGKDGCIAIVHSGSGFKENDQVELY